MQGCSDNFDFKITIYSPEADSQEMEKLTLLLRQELLNLGIESVDLERERNIPDGAKVIEPISWGVILLKLGASGGALTLLIKTLDCWLNAKTSITIEYDDKRMVVNGPLKQDERRQLFEYWDNANQKKEP